MKRILLLRAFVFDFKTQRRGAEAQRLRREKQNFFRFFSFLCDSSAPLRLCGRFKFFKCDYRVLLLSLLIAAFPVAAETKDPAKEQARRMQQMQRKFEQEKSALVQEKAALETQLKEAGEKTEKLEKVEKAAAGAERRAAALGHELAALRSERDAVQARLSEAQRLDETRRKEIDTRTAEQKKLSGQLEQRGQMLTQCEAKNLMLYQYGVDLLQRHTGLPVFNPLVIFEPFTGLRQVEMENLLEEYHDKLEAQKLAQPEAAGSATAAAAR
jgi:hypothetical protein